MAYTPVSLGLKPLPEAAERHGYHPPRSCEGREGRNLEVGPAMARNLLPGIVLQARSGRHVVQDNGGIVICQVRGRLKQERLSTDLVATGDRVRWRHTRPGRGVIEEVLPRRTVLNRRRPGQLEAEQVIVANPDQAVYIFSVQEPRPHLRLLDRLLVIAENSDLPALICANKIDLLDKDPSTATQLARSMFGLYEKIGYHVVYASAHTGTGVGRLGEALGNKLSVLCGPSGVGKSSLLNAIQPELGLATERTSQATGKGRHTTVTVRLWPLDGGGYVADTPGLREAGLWDIEAEELAWHFVEMRPYLAGCRFSSCTHIHEPGCAVKEAVAVGAINPVRYDSYCRLVSGELGG
jgi:ribosome biogenesis GTPase / thiamine phosphate phosphatase